MTPETRDQLALDPFGRGICPAEWRRVLYEAVKAVKATQYAPPPILGRRDP